MLAHERHAELRRLVEETGTIIVSEVARRWDVSEMTIRRDLKELENHGILARVHGGAVAGGALRWRARMDRDHGEKATAVAKIFSLVPQRGCIYLDGSTTIYNLIDHLHQGAGLTVVTNNIDTFQKLSACRGIDPVLIGGNHNKATDNFIGPLARLALSGLSFDVAFCSAYGIRPGLGTVEPSLEDAEIKQIVCERCARVCVAVNHQKLGRQAAGVWHPPGEHGVLATDLAPDDARLAPYRSFFETII